MKCIKSLLVIAIMPFFLSGCWDQAEIENLAMIMAVGIDYQPDERRYQVTVQVVNPNYTSRQTQTKTNTPIKTFSGTGPSVTEALKNINDQLSKQVFFGTMHLLIIDENLARTGIDGHFDFFERNPMIRNNMHVIMTKNSDVADVLKILTPLENIPAVDMLNSLQTVIKYQGTAVDPDLDDVIRATLTERDLAITAVTLKGAPDIGSEDSNLNTSTPETTVEISAIGLFNNEKLQAWGKPEIARGIQWVNGKVEQAPITFKCKQNQKPITTLVTKAETSKKVTMGTTGPEILVDIKVEATLNEVNCKMDLKKISVLNRLEKKTNQMIKKEALKAVKLSQKHSSDVFEFAATVHRQFPDYWQKNKKQWNTIFAELPINIHVKTSLRRSGLRRGTQ